MEYLNQLSRIPLFAGINPSDIPSMLKCLHAHEQTFRKDVYIRLEGDPADFIGIVLQGNIQILQDDFNGKRTITASIAAGDMFAEAIACAGLPALPFNILAVTDCRILFFNVDHLLKQCDSGC